MKTTSCVEKVCHLYDTFQANVAESVLGVERVTATFFKP